MTHKIIVDKNKCVGCGACTAMCPNSFEMKNGKAFAIKSEVEKLTCEEEAKDSCPIDAISIN